jgi:hypothetical protein
MGKMIAVAVELSLNSNGTVNLALNNIEPADLSEVLQHVGSQEFEDGLYEHVKQTVKAIKEPEQPPA